MLGKFLHKRKCRLYLALSLVSVREVASGDVVIRHGNSARAHVRRILLVSYLFERNFKRSGACSHSGEEVDLVASCEFSLAYKLHYYSGIA